MEKKQTIGSMMVEYGLITAEALEQGLKMQEETGRRLGEVLIDMELITQQDIEWILSKQLDIPFIIVDETSVDMELIKLFPRDFLLTNSIIPLYDNEDEIAIVTDDPFNKDAFAAIEKNMGKSVNLSAGSSEGISELLSKILKSEGSSELISVIEAIVERVRETGFYRLDFINRKGGFTINAFGFGIMKTVHTSDSNFKAEDVYKALDVIGIKYFFEHFGKDEADEEYMICIFPAEGALEATAYPAVFGVYGLAVPQDVMFCDIESHNIDGVFHSPVQAHGYSRFITKGGSGWLEDAIYTIDSAPSEFKNSYVKAALPGKCEDCGGDGCENCKYLGLVFTTVEGVYSYSDIINLLKREK